MQPHHSAPRPSVSRQTIPAPAIVAVLTLVALAVRLVQLATPTLRWDEGWSLAHASLPWGDLWRIATEEWHPPLYVALLKLWVPLGTSSTLLRLPSVIAGVAAVPLTYAVGRRWSQDTAMAIAAATLMVFWPLHVYYSQVTRMYALVVLPILGAAWFALSWEERPTIANALGLALTSLAGLWISYYAVFPLAAVWLYAAVCHPRKMGTLAAVALVVVLGYAPWLAAASATLRHRLAADGAGPGPLIDAVRYLSPTLDGMLYAYDAPLHPGLVLAPLVLISAALGSISRRQARSLALAILATALSVAGVVLGAHLTRWFAPRYMVMPAPFLAMLTGWALVRLARRARPAALVAITALVVIYWPASTGSVYAKMLEVVDPIDPAADHAYLSTRTIPADRIYFNVLAKAGWYAQHAGPNDPPWSYAMRWDPIIEPMERIAARVDATSPAPARFWFVLFQGSYGSNAPLKEWLDEAFYPAGEEWRGDTLFAAYVRPSDAWHQVTTTARFANGLTLEGARWATAGEDAVALELEWSGERSDGASLKVFVHLTDATGTPLAQHDTAYSGAGQRHGLLLPAHYPASPTLIVGLYDGATGERVPLVGGGDAAILDHLPL
ncbi:MAG TPA: hypothetical protein GX714_15550 [Chloroflexi bacterium]|nr:hypothetical protein [Chloroflexota bacterium]